QPPTRQARPAARPCPDRPSRPFRAGGIEALQSPLSAVRPPLGLARPSHARTRRDQTLSSENLVPCGSRRLDRVQRRDCPKPSLRLLLRVVVGVIPVRRRRSLNCVLCRRLHVWMIFCENL